ncbi:MAG: hypothetical protein K2X86_09955 [Cytophagaceae bacterium]|nr:hypothetical protein [Cytophagaceae bacterium]
MNLSTKDRIRMRKKMELEALPKEKLLEILEEKEIEIENLNGLIRRLAELNVMYEKRYEAEKKHQLNYKIEARWVDKIVFVLKGTNKFLKATEIVSVLSKKDPYINEWDLGKTCIHLNKAVKFQMIKSYKIPGFKAHYYGLPQWFDTNGEPLFEYKITF